MKSNLYVLAIRRDCLQDEYVSRGRCEWCHPSKALYALKTLIPEKGWGWGDMTGLIAELNNNNKSIVWQPAARGHRAYTDLSAARVRGPAPYGRYHACTVCSLVNWEMTHSYGPIPLLDMRGGASLCKPLEIPGGLQEQCVISGLSRCSLEHTSVGRLCMAVATSVTRRCD